jgi:hypothetical protein
MGVFEIDNPVLYIKLSKKNFSLDSPKEVVH